MGLETDRCYFFGVGGTSLIVATGPLPNSLATDGTTSTVNPSLRGSVNLVMTHAMAKVPTA